MMLPTAWIDKIFLRLQGIYGQQFMAKFSRVEQGIDVGMVNAKTVWAEELGNFSDKPEAISYALQNLPTERAPNAIEFRDICRRAPAKQVPALTYAQSAEDPARAAEFAKRATQAVQRHGMDMLHWAKHPRSQGALDMVFSTAKSDLRFAAIVEKLIADGIALESGRLVKQWDGAGWVKP